MINDSDSRSVTELSLDFYQKLHKMLFHLVDIDQVTPAFQRLLFIVLRKQLGCKKQKLRSYFILLLSYDEL